MLYALYLPLYDKHTHSQKATKKFMKMQEKNKLVFVQAAKSRKLWNGSIGSKTRELKNSVSSKL